MKKSEKVIIKAACIFAALSIAKVFAESPVMKNFVPTEYQFMNELDPAETRAFIKENPAVLETFETINHSVLDGREFDEEKLCSKETKVFKEEVLGDVFYWVLTPGKRPDFIRKEINFSWISEKQYFVAVLRVENGQNRILMSYPTQNIYWNEIAEYYFSRTAQIIKGKDKNKGIIYYENTLDFKSEHAHKFSIETCLKTKGQPTGHIHEANYYRFENEPADVEFKADRDFVCSVLSGWEHTRIEASNFLWDLKEPLKYGLQNAFDQNPATSYVENTADDLMRVVTDEGPVTKLFIINGYAQNESLYSNNNRIIEIADEWSPDTDYPNEELTENNDRFSLSDNCLKYQTIDLNNARVKFSNGYIYVSKIQKGLKFSDTCIAELNMYSKEGFYIFGDLDD